MSIMKFVRFAAVALLGILAVPFITAAPAAAASPWWMYDYNTHVSGIQYHCAEVTSGSNTAGAQIQMGLCNGDNYQQWNINRVGSGSYWRLENRRSGLCANIKGNSTARNTKIIQYGCGSSSVKNNNWKPKLVKQNDRGGLDWYRWESESAPGMCLNVQSASVAAGADLILYTCGAGANNDLFSWV